MICDDNINSLPEDDIPNLLWMSICHLTDVEHFDDERTGYIEDGEPTQVEQQCENEEINTMSLMTSGMVNVNCLNVSTDEMNCHLSTKMRRNLNLCRGENELFLKIIPIEEEFRIRSNIKGKE